jgi:hypothetical protein
MNAFEQRRTTRTVPTTAHGSFAFIAPSGKTSRRDEPSATELSDLALGDSYANTVHATIHRAFGVFVESCDECNA